MSSIKLFTGDDWDIVFTLTIDSIAVDLTGATIKCGVLSSDSPSATLLASTTTVNESGSTRASGIIAASFDRSVTALITKYGNAFLELQVDLSDGRRLTWPRKEVDLANGSIV